MTVQHCEKATWDFIFFIPPPNKHSILAQDTARARRLALLPHGLSNVGLNLRAFQAWATVFAGDCGCCHGRVRRVTMLGAANDLEFGGYEAIARSPRVEHKRLRHGQ